MNLGTPPKYLIATQVAPISHHVRRDIGKSLHHSTPQLSDIPQLDGIVHRPRRQQMAVLVERDRRELAPLGDMDVTGR